MRHAIPLFALSAAFSLSTTIAAQEPAILTSTPATTAQFGATALGLLNGNQVSECSQLQLTCDTTAAVPTWYIAATVKTPSNAFYQGYSGRVTGTPGNYTITSNGDFSLVPPPTADYFAFAVSSDLKIMVHDTGGATAPAVYVRAGTTGNFTPFGAIGAPVVPTYVDSMIGNTLTSWDGTTGVYEFMYIAGLNIMKVDMTLTAPSTVTLGTPVQIAPTGVQKHSQSPMRQWTGLSSELGTGRAMIFSQNDSSADSYFRSSMSDITTTPVAPTLTFDDANWKANPGHIGGSTYWAYAVGTYGNPMQEDICAMASASVPAAGGPVTIVSWAPPKATPQLCLTMIGLAQIPGLPLNPPFTFIRGRLGITLASLTFLPTQAFDADKGECSLTFVTSRLPRGEIDMQVGCFDLATNTLYLGNTAKFYIQ